MAFLPTFIRLLAFLALVFAKEDLVGMAVLLGPLILMSFLGEVRQSRNISLFL